MGTYLIQIEGIGPHHNSSEDIPSYNDANVSAAALAQDLISRGHKITRAEFTVTASQSDNLLTGELISKL